MADENEQQTACKAGRDKQHCKCKQRREAAAAAEAAAANGEQHCACKHDAHDAEGHAVSTEPHLGFIEDLASLIDIQEEATVSRTVLREDGLRAVLFGFDKDQALSDHARDHPGAGRQAARRRRRP